MLRLLLCVVLALPLAAFAELKWDKPWQEFQRSPEDGDLQTKFTFQNIGAAPVTIKSVKTSCGCTSTRLDKKTYLPGERGELGVKFVFGSRKGGHRKMITVTTDDEARQDLNFTVFIHPALLISPALVYWKVGQPAEAKSVQLNTEPGTILHVKKVSSSNPRLLVNLETLSAGTQYAVTVRPADTAQKESGEVTVETDYPPDAPRAYTIHARIK